VKGGVVAGKTFGREAASYGECFRHVDSAWQAQRRYNPPMTLKPDQKIEIAPDVLFQEVGGETVLLDLESEQYFGLDAVGTRIWALLGEGACIGAVVDTLLQEYEVERATLESDVEELIVRLSEAGLVHLGDEA